eukprot:COSAG01_NODE_7444_length_3207_cov_16.815756_1_plen_322_part_00
MAGAPAPSAGSGGDHHRSHRAEVGRLIDLSSTRASRPSGGWPGGRGTTVDTFPWDGKPATAAAAAADASSSSGTRARAGAQGQGAGGGDGVTFGEAAGASITDRARARGLKPYVPTSGEVAPKGGWRVSPQEPIPGGHTIPFKSKPRLGVGALSDRPWCDDRPGCCAAVHTVCAMLRIIHPSSPAMPCHATGALSRALQGRQPGLRHRARRLQRPRPPHHGLRPETAGSAGGARRASAAGVYSYSAALPTRGRSSCGRGRPGGALSGAAPAVWWWRRWRRFQGFYAQQFAHKVALRREAVKVRLAASQITLSPAPSLIYFT